MCVLRQARVRGWPAVLLALTLAQPLHAQDGGAPAPTLQPTAEAYFASVQAWVDAAVAREDPALTDILSAARSAAAQDEWDAAETAVENLARAAPPAGMVPLLRGMLAAGRRDGAAHREHLARAAPALAAGGERALAVETWRYLAFITPGNENRETVRGWLGLAAAAAPEHAGVYFQVGQLEWAADRSSAAITAFERVTQLAPDRPEGWAALATAYVAANRNAEAALAGAEVLRLAPGWIEYRIRSARWLLARGEPNAAFNVLLPVAGDARDFPAIQSLLAQAVERMGGTRAVAHAAAQLREAGGTADQWGDVAQRYSKAGALDDAAAAYRMALAQDPTRGDLGFLLGGVLGSMWDLDGAIAAYEQAEANGFSKLGCAFNLGLMHHARQDYDAAAVWFDRCLEAGGVRPYVLTLRARTEFRAGRLSAALTSLSDSLMEDPDDMPAWLLYGHVLRAQGLTEPARDAYARALELGPAKAGTRYWLGRIALDQDQPEAALRYLRTEFGQGGGGPDVAFWMGVAARRLGATAGARFAWETTLLHASGHADAWVRLGALDHERGALAAAGRSYERAAALGLDSGLLHFHRGELAWAQGDAASARTALTRAVERDPELTSAWRRLGTVHAELGDTGAARRAFAHAYGRERMEWFLQRSLIRFFVGALCIGAFLIVVIVGARLRRRPQSTWFPMFIGRLDLAVLLCLGLLAPIVIVVLGQRMVYASFELQRLANRQAAGFNAALAFRDGLFLGLIPVLYVWWRRAWAVPGRPDLRRVGQAALWGVGGFALFTTPGVVMQLLESDVMQQDLLPRGRNLFNASPQNLVASVLGIGIVSSTAQEIFYRGILYRLTRDQVGGLLAALLSAFLFAAFHFQPAAVWWYFGFGLLAALLLERTRSLAAPITMHVLYNVMQVIV